MQFPFDYTQKVLIAIEFSQVPKAIALPTKNHYIFKRLHLAEMQKLFKDCVPLIVRWLGEKKFNSVLEERVRYWEEQIPSGMETFVHYYIGSEDEIRNAYQAILPQSQELFYLGIYHFEPQACAFPFAFPVGKVPNPWLLGDYAPYTHDSVFWFNFFPPQRYLFEKIYQAWLTFNVLKLKEGGECNQLLHIDDEKSVVTRGQNFVELNLNRFTNAKGFLTAARLAGKQTFTNDSSFIWYGMLLTCQSNNKI